MGICSLLAGAIGEFAGDSCRYKKSKQSDPVLRIGDGESSNRRQKIIIESERGQYRKKNGKTKAPVSRDQQHHYQERQCHGGGIYMDDAPVNLCYKFCSCQASDIAEHVLGPPSFHGHDCNGSEGKRAFSVRRHRVTEKTRSSFFLASLCPGAAVV